MELFLAPYFAENFFHMNKLYFLLSFLIGSLVWSQTGGGLTGTVTDQDGLVVSGAYIEIPELNRTVSSTAQGNYSLVNLPAGTYDVILSFLGYASIEREVTITNTLQRLDFVLGSYDATVQLDEVVVLGQRLIGQAKALNTQKNKGNISNVISADQVGRFPDANMGDALKRIPGITMQTDQGEARDIIIRGLAPNLNSVTLNGDRIPSAEGDNRNIQMDLIPADMIQSIEVNKTLTPDMDADAIGGSVNLIRRSAPQGERISLTAAGGYNPIRESGLYNGSLIYGNRIFNNKLGFVANASLYTTNYGSDNTEFTWEQDDHGNIYANDYQVRYYNVQRKRRSLGLNLDYDLAVGHRLTASALYNWRDDNEDRYRLRYRSYSPVYNDDMSIAGFEGGRIVRDNKAGRGGPRLERQTIQNYTVGGDHIFGQVKMDWGVAYSHAEESKPDQINSGFEIRNVMFGPNVGSTRYPNMRPQDMSLESLATGPAQFTRLSALNAGSDLTNDDEVAARLNFNIPINLMSREGSIMFGGRMRLKNKMRENGVTDYDPTGFDMSSMAAADLINFDGQGFNPSSHYVPGFFMHNSWLGGLDIYNPTLFEQSEDVTYYVENFNANENIYATYIRWDQDLTDQLSMIAGVRLEHTSTSYTANVVEDEETLLGARSVENDYLNILPGLTLNYRPERNTVLRLAATTSLARPNYYNLAPYVNIVPDDTEIDAGNPNLKATRAFNLDLMAEHYFSNVGILSGGVFYKRLNDFLYTSRTLNFSPQQFDEMFPGFTNPIGDVGENWRLVRPQNGDVADFYGAEIALQRQLDFLPGFLSNFGIYLNYTYTHSKAKGVEDADGVVREDLALPGTAPHMANASLSYDGERLTARLSLNHASAYLDQLGDNAFYDRYYDKQTFLDFNASYTILRGLNLFVEINNITNQPLRFYQGHTDRTMQMEYYRPRYLFGIKYDLNNRD